jgi:hypothetical protein
MLTQKFFSTKRNDAANAVVFERLFREIRGQAVTKGWVQADDRRLADKLRRKITNVRTEMLAGGKLKRSNGEFELAEEGAEPMEYSENLCRVLQDAAILSKPELEIALKALMRRLNDEKKTFRLMLSVMDSEAPDNGEVPE